MIYRNIQLRESQDAYDSAEEIAETEEPEKEIVPEEEPVPEEPVGWREAPVYDDPYMASVDAVWLHGHLCDLAVKNHAKETFDLCCYLQYADSFFFER